MSAPAAARPQLSAPVAASEESLVHALAQLPASVRLRLGVTPALRRLADAYGVGDRLEAGPTAFAVGGRELPIEVDAGRAGTLGELVSALTPPGERNPARKGDDRAFAGQRVALVTNLPAPYRLPLFRALAERLEAAGGELRVFFGGAGQKSRPWMGADGELGFPYEFGTGRELPIRRRRRPVVTLDLGRRLAAFAPTIVLAGGFSPAMAGRAAVYARRRGIPFGIWDGDTAVSAPTSGWRTRLRREMLGRSRFAIAYGSGAHAQLRTLYDGPIVIGRNTSPVPEGFRDARGRVELITVADLSEQRKGVDIAIDALRLRPDLDCRLTIVGSGTLEAELRERARGDERIEFAGFLPNAQVRERLAASDAYLFTTRLDVFGLAIVEAMGAGLASLTTRAPGVAADLAVDGVTCAVVADHSPASWAGAIARVVEDGEHRRAIAAGGAEVIAARWTVAHAADAMLAGLRLGLGGGRA